MRPDSQVLRDPPRLSRSLRPVRLRPPAGCSGATATEVAAAAARARRARAAARPRRRGRAAAGAHRQRLEGRVRHRHVAGRSRQLPAAGPRRRSAGADATSRPSTAAATGSWRRSTTAERRRAPANDSLAGGTGARGPRRPRRSAVSWCRGALRSLCAMLAVVAVWQYTHAGAAGSAGRPDAHRAGAGDRLRSPGARAGALAGRHGRGVVGVRRRRAGSTCGGSTSSTRAPIAGTDGASCAVLFA